jgi:ankyrin repeat protein
VKNDESRRLPSLKEVLDRVNESVTDYEFRPATTASDIGSTGDQPLHKAAIWGDVDAAEVLLMHGADVNAHGEDGETPLHMAVIGGSAAMVVFLLSRGADPYLSNEHGQLARDAALTSKNPGIVAAMQGFGPSR